MFGAMETLLYSQTGTRDNRALIRPVKTAWLSAGGNGSSRRETWKETNCDVQLNFVCEKT